MSFIAIAAVIGLVFLIWDCVEVGRNDATNLVNAVFGARVLSRRKAIIIAGISVILGAAFSSQVMETARKGIFDPTVLTVGMALSIYISVYFVDTILLYGFSGFGMPVSTTACLVFELVGASLFVAGPDNVNWPKVGTVVLGIFVSIVVSGIASFLVMRVFRGAIRDKSEDTATLLLHGPWIAGVILTWLTWFMVFKGLRNVTLVADVKTKVFQTYGEGLVLLVLWAGFTFLVHMLLVITHRRYAKYLFHATAVLGMICMAFAFGQNDLANAASPGLAGLEIWRHTTDVSAMADIVSEIPISMWALAGCGILMASGMFTTYAQRVTRAAVNTGSEYDSVALYAPEWCRRIARAFLRFRPAGPSLAQEARLNSAGKKVHYDSIRASVITAVSGSVIAFASGRGLPVSTTYVAFAAILGTGLSDRVFVRGDADLKLGRAIWVVSCWIIAPIIAIVATGTIATIVYRLSTVGIIIAIGINFFARFYLRKRSDKHEDTYHLSALDEDEEEEENGDSSPEVQQQDEGLAGAEQGTEESE
ncbi:MAG: inorganic phosphate transporter [Planctomycetota bacterium]|jgi:phosphate/sulfate permease|nr:inorganic phosphate transporter [Planctomycetota bacterium]MDP6502331.1 inorganic phosphate transporter [Planctomycetota bacterium]